jgi:RTX calcium-binding nonapeptide repeat (4 copies)/Lipase (class 3)
MATKIEAAILAANVYGNNLSVRTEQNTLPTAVGFDFLDMSGGRNKRVDFITGFMASAYKRTGTNEIVISYSGTTDETNAFGNDWIFGNVPAAWCSVISPQLQQAALFYQEVKAQNPTATISFTGHSLGGGIGSVMGVFFNKEAWTFDQGPFVRAADSFGSYIGVVNAIAAAGYFDPNLASYVPGIDGFITRGVPSPSRLAREHLVHQTFIVGEVLSLLPANPFLGKIGTNFDAHDLDAKPIDKLRFTPAGLGLPIANPVDLHSQSLLTGLLISPEFEATIKLNPRLLARLMRGNPATVWGINNPKKLEANLLDLLVQRQYLGDETLSTLANNVNLLLASVNDSSLGFTVRRWEGKPSSTGPDTFAQDIAIDAVLAGIYQQAKDRLPTRSNYQDVTNVIAQVTGGLKIDLNKLGESGVGVLADLRRVIQYLGAESSVGQNRLSVADLASANWVFQTSGGALNYIGANARSNLVIGDFNDDVVVGGSGSDLIFGEAGKDRLSGAEGNDQLIGGSGDDTLFGGSGDDFLAGGKDFDIYKFDGGPFDKNDVIYDSDGLGKIEIGGITLGSARRPERQHADKWRSKALIVKRQTCKKPNHQRNTSAQIFWLRRRLRAMRIMALNEAELILKAV